MGNSPITVGIRTDQNHYSAGSKITGRVYVSITKESQPIQALMLKIVGAEHVVIHHTSQSSHNNNNSSESSRTTEHHYERANSTFLQLEYPLHTFPRGQLPPGQYEYPFQIQLPHNLPSSMTCRTTGGESYCEVQYELTATLQKMNSTIFSTNPSAQQKVDITSIVVPSSAAASSSSNNKEIVSSSQGRRRHLPMEQIPVTNCCCRRKGIMTLEMKVNQTILQPDDIVIIEFRCQNQSSVTVKSIRVQMEQIIEWRCNGHIKTIRNVLDQHHIRLLNNDNNDNNDDGEYPELRSRKQQQQRRRRRHHQSQHEYFGVPSSQEEGGRGGGDDEPPEEGGYWRSLQLRVPSQSQDSYYSGRHVEVRHILSLQLQTKGCCTTNPEASTLIHLHRKVPWNNDFHYNRNNPSINDDPLLPLTTTTAGGGVMTTPSAPLEVNTFNNDTQQPILMPSAPSALYDNANVVYNHSDIPPMAQEAQALLLPADWNAQMAEVVHIPMVDAIVLEESSSAGGGVVNKLT